MRLSGFCPELSFGTLRCLGWARGGVSEVSVNRDRGFSLLELLISIAIVAVLLSILLPGLAYARRLSSGAVCASNLRQIGMAWDGYLSDPRNRGEAPRAASEPAWRYGGASFRGTERVAILDAERPINRYLADDAAADSKAMAQMFKCPGDVGVFARGIGNGAPRSSILTRETCYQTFGTSYRANESAIEVPLDDGTGLMRPLKAHEVYVSASRLILLGDSAWYYATRSSSHPDAAYEASWHGKPDAGNMLAADGSVRFETFARDGRTTFTTTPRPDRE